MSLFLLIRIPPKNRCAVGELNSELKHGKLMCYHYTNGAHKGLGENRTPIELIRDTIILARL